MRRFRHVFALAAAVVITASAAAQAQQPGYPSWLEDAEREAGQQLFKDHCGACHGKRTGVPFAPNLIGVVGRPAGSEPGFPYSPALKNSGLIWTEDNLNKWLADNSKLVPNTLMPHVSISDPAERIYIIAYLKGLKPAH